MTAGPTFPASIALPTAEPRSGGPAGDPHPRGTSSPPAEGTVGPLGPLAPLIADLHEAILAWYRAGRRRLAFRETDDPYGILVAEVMAQQTQVERVDPAWRAFLERFPTPAALADAPLADVLRAWRGLGYHRRARDLQGAARRIVASFAGRVPDDPTDLAMLPGVGPYTARAVAAIAFHRPVVPLDTNSARVLTRLAGSDGSAPWPRRKLQEFADATVPPGEARAWAEALMELGSRLCRPRRPRCGLCPARSSCLGRGRFLGGGASVGSLADDPPAGGRRRPAAGGMRAAARSRRWRRGRIIDRLREVSADGWLAIEDAVGGDAPEAAAAVLEALVADGLVERSADGQRVRLAR